MYISRIAKDGRMQSASRHLQECADYAYMIGKKFEVPEICRLTALYHDMGKLSSEFQNYLTASYRSGKRNSARGSVIHATQGAKFLYESQQDTGDCLSMLVSEISAICIANHHGSLMDGVSPGGDTPFRDRMIQEKYSLHYKEVTAAAEKEPVFQQDLPDAMGKCKKELAEFLENCRRNHLNIEFMLHLLTKSIFSCLVDSDRYNAYCFEIKKKPETKVSIPPWEDLIRRLEKKITGFRTDSGINAIRQEISRKCLLASDRPKGIYLLNAPTGGGKTLSSLRFALSHAEAHKAEHIIYVIPYLSVLEQTAKEIRDALQIPADDNFILEHHSNRSIREDPAEAQSYRLLTDRWDSPVILTTMVQFLESIYSCKSSDLRKFHNMANAVIVFDEVQALPMKCTYLFNEAVNYLHYCAGCSILFCTATQPPLHEVERPVHLSKAPELISWGKEDFAGQNRTHIQNSTIPGGYNSYVSTTPHTPPSCCRPDVPTIHRSQTGISMRSATFRRPHR